MSCFKRIKAVHYLMATVVSIGYGFLIDYWLLQNLRQPTRFDGGDADHR